MADPAPSPEASQPDVANAPRTALPEHGGRATLAQAEAALRSAGLQRFRLIRPARPAQPAPGATTVLPPRVAAEALAAPTTHDFDATPTVVLPPQVAPRGDDATAPRADGPRPPSGAALAADPAVLAEWITQLGRMTRDLHTACVVHLPAADAAATVCAAWPASEPDAPAATGIAGRAIEAKKYLVEPSLADAGLRVIALPLVLAGLPRHAVVARISRPANTSVSADLKPLLQASAWLKVLLAAHSTRTVEFATAPAPAPTATAVATSDAPQPPTQAAAMRDALDLLAATLEHRELVPAATALVNRLAAQLRAGRVSLGLLEGRAVRLLAVSGSAAFDPATALSATVRDAMGEALRQGAMLAATTASATEAPREDGAQRALLREARCAAVCTIPFADEGRACGAVTIEWPDGGAVDAAAGERARATLALAAPVLAALRRAGETPARRLRATLLRGAHRLAGPRHPLPKLAGLALLLLLAVAAVLPGMHRVAGEAVLRGSVQRVVLAPVDGYVATAAARPGDVVAAGAVLATLDDQALQLEVAKWQAEYERLDNEYREALSQLDSAKVAVLRSSIDRAAAEYELASDNLARAAIRAPLAGVVVSGDFSQQIGAPVQRGATLFELAPLDGYRIEIRVPERDVGRLAPGQRGRLRLQALPGSSLEVVVERVTPVSEVVDGRNVFAVEARLVGRTPPVLRPGMQGVAKLDLGRERLLWLWTHEALDWLRLNAWRLGIGG